MSVIAGVELLTGHILGKGILMRVAIPVWEDKVSPVFDTALKLLVIDCEDQREVSRLVYHIGEDDLLWKCHRIASLAPDVIICGAVSHLFLNILRAADLEVIEHVSGRAEEVIEAYLKGDVLNSRFLMPGCRRQRTRCPGGKRIGWQNKNHTKMEDMQ